MKLCKEEGNHKRMMRVPRQGTLIHILTILDNSQERLDKRTSGARLRVLGMRVVMQNKIPGAHKAAMMLVEEEEETQTGAIGSKDMYHAY
jgi:hypothetical protein